MTQINEIKITKEAVYATGKRKSAIAKVWLLKGDFDFTINSTDPTVYLGSEILLKNAIKPLECLGLESCYKVIVKTIGGGVSGQSDAIRLGLSKALIEINSDYRQSLKENGFLTRDSRVKERKKYGRKKARKGFQFRKR